MGETPPADDPSPAGRTAVDTTPDNADFPTAMCECGLPLPAVLEFDVDRAGHDLSYCPTCGSSIDAATLATAARDDLRHQYAVDDVFEDYDLAFTNAVKDKCDRMLTQRGLYDAIRGYTPDDDRFALYDKTTSEDPEYHLHVPGGVVIVLVVKHYENTLVVVTQMHSHVTYPTDDDYVAVDTIPTPDI